MVISIVNRNRGYSFLWTTLNRKQRVLPEGTCSLRLENLLSLCVNKIVVSVIFTLKMPFGHDGRCCCWKCRKVDSFQRRVFRIIFDDFEVTWNCIGKTLTKREKVCYFFYDLCLKVTSCLLKLWLHCSQTTFLLKIMRRQNFRNSAILHHSRSNPDRWFTDNALHNLERIWSFSFKLRTYNWTCD